MTHPANDSSPTRHSRLISSSPVYYGWVILAVGALGGVMTSPGQTYAVSAFIDHIIADLGLSRSLVSTLYTVGTLTASLALPYVGRQFDRRGARFMTVLVSLLLGLACLYMGTVRGAVTLGLGFFALRLLGQGSLSLISRNTVNQWWVRRRGMANGVAGLAVALLGSGGFPNLINGLIPHLGWRGTYMALGVLLLAVMVPLGWVFVRNRPEDYGLQPDGGVPTGQGDDAPPLQEDNWTLQEALRSSAFWLVAAGLASMSMLNTGLTFHLFSIFKDGGLSAAVTASVFVPIAATGAVVQLAGGVLIDRVPLRLMLALALLLEAVVLVMAPTLASVEMAFGFGFLMGMQGGLEMIVSGVVWARYFGRRHMGAITGVASTLMVASSALGPMPFGIARDLMGGYGTVLSIMAALPLLLAVATLLFCRPPRRG